MKLIKQSSYGVLLPPISYQGPISFTLSHSYSALRAIGKRMMNRTEKGERRKATNSERREKQATQKELAFLKSQFNAHMTFNVLTDVYSKVYGVNQEAARALELLSDILRYSVDYEATQRIPVGVEIDCIRRFVELQRLLNQSVCVEFTCEGDYEKEIFPRILIGLVENAFKHGISDDPDRPLRVRLSVKGDIRFEVENAKSKHRPASSHGIGTQNMKQMLDLHYKGCYQLHIEESDSSYLCQLRLAG